MGQGDEGTVDDEGKCIVWVTWDRDSSKQKRPTLPRQVSTIKEAECLDPGFGDIFCASSGDIPPTQKRVLPGFELWIGDVDGAINIAELRKRGFSAVLNMALGDCQNEQESRGFQHCPWQRVSVRMSL